MRRSGEGKDGRLARESGVGKGDVRYWDVDRDESRVDERRAKRSARSPTRR